METILLLSLVTATVSYTVAETRLFRPPREWLAARRPWLGHLVACGYCFGHWTAFALVALYRPRLFQGVGQNIGHGFGLLDLFLTALVIAWLGAFQWITFSALMKWVGK